MLKNLKRYISIMLTAAIVLTVMSAGGISVSAESYVEGNGWSFAVDTGTLTVTTDEGIDDWNQKFYLSTDRNTVLKVVLTNGVSSISDWAFVNCNNLASVEIPNSVESIGEYAFQYCSLASIDIPVSVRTIGAGSFNSCSNIASIVLPNGITSIEDYVFDHCTNLTSVTIPDSVGSIGSSSFSYCSALESINIPNGVQSIGSNAFGFCSKLNSVTIPSSVVSIGRQAFTSCSALTSITIPEGVRTIDESAFSLTKLESVFLPSTITSVGWNAFKANTLTQITYPANLTVTPPATATQLKYEIADDGLIITSITLGNGIPLAVIPDEISGHAIVSVDQSFHAIVSEKEHTHKGGMPSCTEFSECVICSTGYGELLPHTGGTATCTEKAKCDVCGNEYGEIDPNSHTGGTATCTARAVCTLCGTGYGELLPHTGGTATCTERAKCDVCGNEYGEIDPNNHTGGTATCTAKAVCDICGQEYGDFAAHTLVKTEAVPPTCTAAGNEEYWTCDLCQKLFADENGISEITEIPITAASGHNYVNGKCTVCGVSDPNYSQPPIIYPSIPSNPTTSAATPQTQSKEPSIQGDNGKTGWDIILEIIRNTPDGGTVKVNMNGASELPKEIGAAIQGRDIELVLDMGGGFVWTVNGMNVIKAKTVNMGVRKLSKIPKSTVQEFFGDSKTVQLDLRHSGDFGFTAELTVDLGSKYNGMYANSYCYQSNDFEFGGSSEIINGQANLLFSHASSWLITIENSPVQEDVSSAAGVTADSNTIDFDKTVPYSFLSVIIILGIGLVYFKKSRQK